MTDLIHTIFKTHGAGFLPYFARLIPQLDKLLVRAPRVVAGEGGDAARRTAGS